MPSLLRKSSVIDFLLRPSLSQLRLAPASVGVPKARLVSPPPGISTLMTSAPNSPRIVAQYGPAIIVEISSTFRPSSGIGLEIGGVVIGPS